MASFPLPANEESHPPFAGELPSSQCLTVTGGEERIESSAASLAGSSTDVGSLTALQTLLTISSRLGESSDLSQVLSGIIDALRDVLQADRASVFVYDAAVHELIVHVGHGLEAASSALRIPASKGIVGSAAESRMIVAIPDAYDDERFDRSFDEQTGYRTKTLLAVPLLDHDGALVGVAQVLNKKEGFFTASDCALAKGIAAQAAVALKRAALLEDHIARVRLENELDVARSIQQSCFPTSLPQIKGYDLAARTTPTERCGGDAYDCLALPGNPPEAAKEKFFLFVADATGHGVGPALSSMQARAMARVAARLGQPLVAAVREVNEQLCQDLPPGRFVTSWFGLLHGDTHVLESFSAGQGPLFVYRYDRDVFESVDSDAPPFGVIDDGFPCETPQLIELHPRDIVIVLTDGYYEAMNPRGQQWGDGPVKELVRTLRDRPCGEIMDALDRAVLRFSDSPTTLDDRTCVLLRRHREC